MVDLFCGLGGWAEGGIEEGYEPIGFDIERHIYGEHRYPAQLVIQDVLTLHGSQFRDAALIVASPPCQKFSYMAMPWSLAKAKAAAIRDDDTGEMAADLTRLFDACFRIQREASAAAGRHIPMVVENVRGAQKWIGRARWNYGSFYLWGDVPALMPMTFKGFKVAGEPGLNWANYGDLDYKAKAFNSTAVRRMKDDSIKHDGSGWRANGTLISSNRMVQDGIKVDGGWFGTGNDRSPMRQHSSRSPARKAASALIAKIPLALSRHIASVYKPEMRGLFE